MKAGFRTGDDAPMAVIELVDRNIEAKKIDKPKKVENKDKKTPETAQVSSTEDRDDFVEYEFNVPTANLSGTGGAIQYLSLIHI